MTNSSHAQTGPVSGAGDWRQPPLQGRVALITGSARGIGLGIARRFAAAGAHLVLCDRDAQVLDETVADLRRAGISADGVAGDVSLAADVRRIIASTLAIHGKLDVLVNNAGGSAYTPNSVDEVSEADYNKVLDWNVRSTFLLCQEALPALRASKGAIVNMTSLSGQIGRAMFSPQYSAAKAAIIGLTRNLAKHYGASGIRVNAIAPGVISSGPRFDAIWAALDQESVLSDIALRRLGTTEEIADVAIFLACDLSRYVSGVIVNVDGGQLCA